MKTKTAPPQPEGLPETAPQKGVGPFRGTARFVKNLFKEHDFWTRMGGVSNGLILITQGAAGFIYLATIPLILQPLAGAACCALVGAGLYGMRHGITKCWMSLETVCDKTFHRFNPLRKVRLWAKSLANALGRTMPARKLRGGIESATARVASNPRFQKWAHRPMVQRFLKSRVARSMRGLTQTQQDVFLAGLAIEGSLVTIAFCSIAIAIHVASAPLTVGGLLTAGMVAAAYEVGSSSFGLYCYAKTLSQINRARKAAKRAVTHDHAPAPAATAAAAVAAVAQQDNQLAVAAAPVTANFNHVAPAKTDSSATPASYTGRHRKTASPSP